MSHPDAAEPYHPITAPLNPPPNRENTAQRCTAQGSRQANTREGFYLISKTSWRLSSYFFFHSFASISFVMI